jgi:alkylation response protein AidB-like acyl-CoA dehydrogenase
MEFALSAEQSELRAALIDFGKKHLRDDVITRDREAKFSRKLWDLCADVGIQGLPFPEEYGGGGKEPLDAVVALEALGYACLDGGLLFGISAQMWSVQMPIHRYGTPDQRSRYLPPLSAGAWIGAHGMSEPNSGSDAFSLQTTAKRDGDVYVLNGSKTFVSEGPVADLFLVFATVNPALGPLGVTGFLIERETPGLRVGSPIEKMGLRTSPMSELIFEDCRVPVGNRLGREGRGTEVFNDSMEWERSGILAGCLGTMERQLEACTRYARERRQFGKRIGEFQSVSNKLVSMKVRLETSRLVLYKAVWLKQQGKPSAEAAAVAKLYVSEAFTQSCLDALQLHGGYGFTTEYQVERDLRDAIGSTLYSGTSEIQRAILARSMGF